MRTLQVVNVRWYNATAWYGVTLSRILGEAGHPSLVVGLADTDPLRQARHLGLECAELPLNSMAPHRLPALVRGMEELLAEFRPDVVNCHRGESFILWALLKRRFGFALVRTRGDQRLPRNNIPNRWLHRRAADAIVSTSSRMSRHFLTRLGVPEDRLFTVIGGVDTARFHASAEARARARVAFGINPHDFVMGIVGRMDEVKGIRETVRALALARSSWPGGGKLRLLVIGFASQYSVDDVNAWSEEAGLGPLDAPDAPVMVSGRVERPEEAINALDMGILASLGSETIARAALEIMACGVPLIGSTVGVMPDILPEGLLFAPGDVPAMSGLMIRAAEPAWLDAARSACRGRIFGGAAPPVPGACPIGGLTLEDFRGQTLEIYARALERAGLPGGRQH